MLDLVDDSLDGLGLLVVLGNQFAALKVLLTADCVKGARDLAAPAGALRKTAAQKVSDEASVQSEIACVLTLGERSTGDFLDACMALTTT